MTCLQQYHGPTLLTDLHYLPSIAYFVHLLPYATIRLEAWSTYQKQCYNNRCYILTSQAVHSLTIPMRQSSKKKAYHTAEIDHGQSWKRKHWRSLCTAYGKAPYFTYFADYFYEEFQRRSTYLFDFNLALLRVCLRLLQLDKKIELSVVYGQHPAHHVVDARNCIKPHNRLTKYEDYTAFPYPQVFGHTFHPNLSIVDLLFCTGPEAINILQAICGRLMPHEGHTTTP